MVKKTLHKTIRARDLGIIIGEYPTGPENAITDVPGVKVGHSTLTSETSEDRTRPIINTGVTVIVPHNNIWSEPVFAGVHRLNGSGDMTGVPWIQESGELTSAIGLTNTHSLGTVRDALVKAQVQQRNTSEIFWSLPVVAETFDGLLSDINGHHVSEEHVFAALSNAAAGPVPEGSVGSGRGMICHDFKGGIGTASRVFQASGAKYTLGVLVQSNYGRRERLRINGKPIGESIDETVVPVPHIPNGYERGSGSIIVVVATDAPLLPHQCERIAQRASLAIGRMGGTGEQHSGDLMLAFSTGNRGLPSYAWDNNPDVQRAEIPLRMVAPQLMTTFFDMTVEATEEAITNSIVAAETVHGPNDTTAYGLDPELLRSIYHQT
ncbi:P1 family peptidase [Enteractinococcus fodinae]|uniref:D-aminopeptidase n=1 Tax=Enteractinococcus fodinae TaxID=684663 RepID=A0ABU2B4E1_9MICC|nr:P1 family peptidase [Enteractinococcus fodinae]MDR7347869.1 D-aminopeptidase [Enteractinococcus fodinae]